MELPLYDTTPTQDALACGDMIGSRSASEWVQVPERKERWGDILIVERGVGAKLVPCHVGIWVEPHRMLHIDEGRTSCAVRYPSPFVRGRVCRIVRHPSLA